MAQALDAFAVDVDVIVAPQGFEFGAERAKLVDELADFGNRAGARRVRPERADHEARHAFPIILRRPDAGIAEDQAKDVALAGRERAIVGQHRCRRAIPRDDIPGGGLDQGGAGIERIKQALQARGDAFGRGVANLGRTPESEQEEMFALDVGQHQRTRRSGSTRLAKARRPGPAPATCTRWG